MKYKPTAQEPWDTNMEQDFNIYRNKEFHQNLRDMVSEVLEEIDNEDTLEESERKAVLLEWKPGQKFVEGTTTLISENYPPGAEFDSSAPYNEPVSSEDHLVNFNDNGELELITRTHTGPEDWEDNKVAIDPSYLNKLIGEKLGIPEDTLKQFENFLEIIDFEEYTDDTFRFFTKYGVATATFDELESAYEEGRRETSKHLKI
jgi:hypothetical protein